MKISIGAKIFDGPWGGGNLFVKNLSRYLIDNNHKVVFNLFDDDIDIILLTDPRKASDSSNYSHKEIVNYLKHVNSKCLVVHRINECDERKNTTGLNKLFIDANNCADQTVFVSSWLQKLFEKEGLINNNSVIMSGSDKKVFNSKNKSVWDKNEKMRIVTHHWGANWNKGFNIYKKLDNLLSEPVYKDKLSFTYIGNLPDNFSFKNSHHIKPAHGEELAKLLKTNHMYITASINEPSGNHHIEASQCGLPILYIDSGGIPEFCKGYGVSFKEDQFEIKLNELIENYDIYSEKMKSYPFDSIKMSKDYLNLFKDMKTNEALLINNRNNELDYLIYPKLIFKIFRSIQKYIFYRKYLSILISITKRVYLKSKSIIVN